jgi:hypothetical protein
VGNFPRIEPTLLLAARRTFSPGAAVTPTRCGWRSPREVRSRWLQGFHELADPFEREREVPLGVCVGESEVVLTHLSEGAPGEDGDARLVEQSRGEFVGQAPTPRTRTDFVSLTPPAHAKTPLEITAASGRTTSYVGTNTESVRDGISRLAVLRRRGRRGSKPKAVVAGFSSLPPNRRGRPGGAKHDVPRAGANLSSSSVRTWSGRSAGRIGPAVSTQA